MMINNLCLTYILYLGLDMLLFGMMVYIVGIQID